MRSAGLGRTSRGLVASVCADRRCHGRRAAATGVVKTDRDSIPTSQDALPLSQTLPDTIAVTGKLALDRQQLRIAAAASPGASPHLRVRRQSVKAGQPLAQIYSPDYVSARKRILLAAFPRHPVAGHADSSLRDDAEETFRAAASRLKVLVLPTRTSPPGRSGQADQYLLVRAPIGGVVDPAQFDAALSQHRRCPDDRRRHFDPVLYFNSYRRRLRRTQLGQQLDFQTARCGARLLRPCRFIAPSVDAATPHPAGALRYSQPRHACCRPEMFVSGKLRIGEPPRCWYRAPP